MVFIHHLSGSSWLDILLPMQSVHITTNVVGSNSPQARCTRYNIMFVSDLRKVGGFLRVLRFPPTIKLTATIIIEILLKVALNTIILKIIDSFDINTTTFNCINKSIFLKNVENLILYFWWWSNLFLLGSNTPPTSTTISQVSSIFWFLVLQ